MSAWIYLFSKFSSEALLLEALFISLLIAGYAAFWILRKRRLGAIRAADVPAPLVKAYLSELIGDAQVLRTQLFGLLGGNGAVSAEALAQAGLSRAMLSAAGMGATPSLTNL